MVEASPLALAYVQRDETSLVAELADTGFLRAYVGWASDQTDAPPVFHIGTGLATIASCLGNRVNFYSWGMKIFPNIWLCLLAPSGFYRKSTSIRYAVEMLRDIDAGMILPKDFSRELLVKVLGERPDAVLTSDEFGELLAKLGREYNSGAKEMLTGLFDGDRYDRKTLNTSSSIENPSITILTASTVDWISDRVSSGDMRGGFLSRFLFLPASAKGREIGIAQGFHPEMREELLIHLRWCKKNTVGTADFREVKTLIDRWIREFEGEINDDPDPKLMGFFSRSGLYIQKLAILFQMADNPRVLTISPEAANKAIIYWEYLSNHIREIITEKITTTKSEKGLRAVLEILERSGDWVNKSDVLAKLRMLSNEAEPYFRTLVATGQIEIKRVKTGKPGRPPEMFRITNGKNYHAGEIPPLEPLE